MVDHTVTIDHTFKSGGAEVLASVDSAKNSIKVTVRLGPSEEKWTMTIQELVELAELFTSASAFLQGKPGHEKLYKQAGASRIYDPYAGGL